MLIDNIKDREKLRTTDQGYIISQSKLTKVGSMQYLGKEIESLLPTKTIYKNKIYDVAVTESELFKDEVINSFENLPVTLLHPDEDVNSSNWKELAVGYVRNVRREKDYLVGDVMVYDENVIKEIKDNGIKELSLGYDCQLNDNKGVLEKVSIKGNHVAIVPVGRAGSECRINDKKPNNLKQMIKRKVLIDSAYKVLSKFKKILKDEDLQTEEDIELKIQELTSLLEELKGTISEDDNEEKDNKISELQNEISELQKQLEELRGKNNVTDDADETKTSSDELEQLKEENKALKEQNQELISVLEEIKNQSEAVVEEEEKESVLNDAKTYGVQIKDSKASSTFIKKQILLDNGINPKELNGVKSINDSYKLFKMVKSTSGKTFKIKDNKTKVTRIAPTSILSSKKSK